MREIVITSIFQRIQHFFERGWHGLHGSKVSLRRHTFYVCHNFYVGCVGQTFFLRGLIFLYGSKLLQASKLFVQFGSSSIILDWH